MEDVGFNLKDINASDNIALSNLQQNIKKTNHLTPVTIVLIKTRLGKSKFKKNRILLDGGHFRIYYPRNICS